MGRFNFQRVVEGRSIEWILFYGPSPFSEPEIESGQGCKVWTEWYWQTVERAVGKLLQYKQKNQTRQRHTCGWVTEPWSVRIGSTARWLPWCCCLRCLKALFRFPVPLLTLGLCEGRAIGFTRWSTRYHVVLVGDGWKPVKYKVFRGTP